MGGPRRRLRPGTELAAGGERLWVEAVGGRGAVHLRFNDARAARRLMSRVGEPPLPPYIHRAPGEDLRADRRRYQTVYAARPGSVAAPTAGLHFSPGLLDDLRRAGIAMPRVTLHVGWGTFQPLPDGDLEGFRLHAERFEVPPAAAEAVAKCRARGGRVVACGTTAARVLESTAGPGGAPEARSGETELFIAPGYRWRLVDGLLTNFHLPRSSLLMLVSALAGRERVLAAYAEAVRGQYAFYSYGDAMLLL